MGDEGDDRKVEKKKWSRGCWEYRVYSLHEHLAPTTLFSVVAFSQLQFRADCFPHEHLACEAHTQWPFERPQQVVGTAIAV